MKGAWIGDAGSPDHRRSQVHLTSDCCTYQTASRIPTQPVGPTRAGDKVLVEHNGGWFLWTVAEVAGQRFKVRDGYGIAERWVTREQMRVPER